jgi:hypothetical protein
MHIKFLSAVGVVALLGVPMLAQRGPRTPPSPGKSWVNGASYEGETITADLPANEQLWNVGSKVDGAGMCVDTSLEMAAIYSGLEEYRGFRDYWASHAAGGNYPQGVDKQLAAYAKLKGLPKPLYLQYEGRDVGAVLDAIDRTGRMACITYGYSPRYGNQTIAHMVCSPKSGSNGKYGVVRDNNKIGGVDGTEGHLYEWMDREELIRRIEWPSGQGWIFVWLNPAPAPPAPSSRIQRKDEG